MTDTRQFRVTVSGATGSPAWTAGLAAGQVRNLIGTYAPSNGKVRLASVAEGTATDGVIPAEWNYPYQVAGGANAVINAWSGGRGDTVGKRLFIHGGGHADSCNNGLYYYDFNGATVPTGFVLAPNSLSARALFNPQTTDPASSNSVHADNRPSAVHTYDQCWYNAALGRYYRLGGSPYQYGGKTIYCYYYDINTSQWSSIATGGEWAMLPTGGLPTESAVSATVFASPDESKMLWAGPGQPMRMFTSATQGGAPVALGLPPFAGESTSPVSCAGARSTTADKWVTVENPGIVREWTINWTANTATPVTKTHASHTTYLPSGSGAGSIVYDAAHSSGPCYWMFGFERHQGATMSTQLLRMDDHTSPTPYRITAYTMTGDSIAGYGTSFGSFNRHVWFPAWRVIGTVQAYNAPMSVIKVPT